MKIITLLIALATSLSASVTIEDVIKAVEMVESTDYSPAENNKIGDLDRLNQDL